MYIYERQQWPQFSYSLQSIAKPLARLSHDQGRLLGRMEALGFTLKQEANLQTLIEDVLKTSEIEGEILDQEQVRSSLARRLGLDIAGLKPTDREVDGVVNMLLDATQNCQAQLTAERLFSWHTGLFPSARSGVFPIRTGIWRDDAAGPMQVVSGVVGREKVHFQAPAAKSLKMEMARFLNWFNDCPEDGVIKSAIAHLWFVTLHPFDDGNGRIARAIADMVLADSERTAQRFYSMSSQIRVQRKAYYEILERTQKGSLDVTAWLEWYLETLSQAINTAHKTQELVLRKARFWNSAKSISLNERQMKVLNKLLDEFEGKLTSSKWAKLARCSQDTAHRDIVELVAKQILKKDEAGGRSTSYSLIEPQ